MKYKLITKNIITGKVENEKIYPSINQIAKELNQTYCSCQKNYLMNIGEDKKEPKKRTQKIFNNRYSIVNA
jgi:predicted HicB family RNase H-like nuclease